MALVIASSFSISACRDGRSETTKATDALNAGLKAQVAGKSGEAIKDYRKVLAHDPKNKFAFYNLGLIDQRAGRDASAIQFYRQALAVDARYVPALFNLAILLTGSSPDEATTLYRSVVELAPTNAAAHLNLGLLLRARGQTAEGDALIAKAHELEATTTTAGPATTTTAP
jgi:tetratricopeptide (TPR) repeat protein